MSTDKTETSYKLAKTADPSVVQGDESGDGVFKDNGKGASLLPSQKKGHRCCGVCCDVRRAVIIVNCVNIGVLVMVILSLFSMMAMNDQPDDDELHAAISFSSKMPMGAIIGFTIVQILMSGAGVYGADSYDKSTVAVAAALYCFGILTGIFHLNIGKIIYNICFAYPHLFLIREIDRGIMTKENYPNEKHSCCCV